MRKLLAILGALAIFGGISVAEAGWNIKQKDTGTAVWTDGNDRALVGSGGIINVYFADISTLLTQYIVSTRKGRIVAVRGVTFSPGNGALGGDSTFTFLLSKLSPDNGVNFTGALTHFVAITSNTMAFSALSDVGTTNSNTILGFNSRHLTGGSGTGANTSGSDGEVEVGQVIAIHTDGSGTGVTPAMITIVIE